MNFDKNIYTHYINLLNTFGEFRGFKEKLKLDEVMQRLDKFDLNTSKSIIINIDYSSSISLITINDLLMNINKYICKETILTSFARINNELLEDEVIVNLLIL